MSQNQQNKNEYLKLYKELHYSKTRKIITFPLLVEDFNLLENASSKIKQTNNTLAKNIVVNFLRSTPMQILDEKQQAYIREFIRISRGIANNINQLAYTGNIGESVDVNIIFNELKRQEDNFKYFITNQKSYDY